MYQQPYSRYQQQDHPEYEPAPYQNSNPFQAYPSQGQLNDQRRNKNKRRPPPRRPTPVVPQPTGTTAPVPEAPQAPNNILPSHKWAIVPEDTPALEPPKHNEELKAAQNVADKLQETVEAAISCLLEYRLEYPLENFGFVEAFGLQKKIEVLVGTATIGTIIIAGIEYFKVHGLPCTSPDRMLGRCTFLGFNQDGVLHGFTDMSKLPTSAQEDRLVKYNQVLGPTVKGFLNHFAGSGTFYRRPETVVQHGIRCTTLQEAMANTGDPIEGFQGPNWWVLDVYDKLNEQMYLDLGTMAIADFNTLKGPAEARTALLKSCNVHAKELIGALSYLPNATRPNLRLKEADLAKMIGVAPEPEASLDPDVLEHLKGVETILNQILERLHNMRVIGELQTAKEELKQIHEASKNKITKEEPKPAAANKKKE